MNSNHIVTAAKMAEDEENREEGELSEEGELPDEAPEEAEPAEVSSQGS